MYCKHFSQIFLHYKHSRSLFQVQGHSLMSAFLWSLPSQSESQYNFNQKREPKICLRYITEYCDLSKIKEQYVAI